METAPSLQGFSVDFLLAEVAASVVESPAPDTTDRLMQAAHQAQQQAEQIGDFGTTLITEVQQYLADASEDLQQFAAIARQLGDMCVDHTIEHELSEEPEHTSHAESGSHHTHGGGSTITENRVRHTAKSGKKRKAKKRQRRSFLELYIWRLQQQKA